MAGFARNPKDRESGVRIQESEFRSQNEQPEENIQYPVPHCGMPQSGRISNVQGEQPGDIRRKTGVRIKPKT